MDFKKDNNITNAIEAAEYVQTNTRSPSPDGTT